MRKLPRRARARQHGGGGRLTGRSLWLAGELLFIAARFAFLFMRGGPAFAPATLRVFASGLPRLARVFVSRVVVTGPRPTAGLLISNHLGYLDIMLLAWLSPCVFVSKHEVKSWLVFGWFAALGGTVFVQRSRRGKVGAVGKQIGALLDGGELVILFPKGTSSTDGKPWQPRQRG